MGRKWNQNKPPIENTSDSCDPAWKPRQSSGITLWMKWQEAHAWLQCLANSHLEAQIWPCRYVPSQRRRQTRRDGGQQKHRHREPFLSLRHRFISDNKNNPVRGFPTLNTVVFSAMMPLILTSGSRRKGIGSKELKLNLVSSVSCSNACNFSIC